MNATFDRRALLKLFRLLKKGRSPAAQWLRVTAVADQLICESGGGLVSLPALVLEPGAFTTRRPAFERVLSSYTGKATLMLQADANRFRIDAFSGQLLDYHPTPALPADYESPPDGLET
jgi:hypothetical protein